MKARITSPGWLWRSWREMGEKAESPTPSQNAVAASMKLGKMPI